MGISLHWLEEIRGTAPTTRPTRSSKTDLRQTRVQLKPDKVEHKPDRVEHRQARAGQHELKAQDKVANQVMLLHRGTSHLLPLTRVVSKTYNQAQERAPTSRRQLEEVKHQVQEAGLLARINRRPETSNRMYPPTKMLKEVKQGEPIIVHQTSNRVMSPLVINNHRTAHNKQIHRKELPPEERQQQVLYPNFAIYKFQKMVTPSI